MQPGTTRRPKRTAKGYARITQPMVRENGVLVPTSWDHALDVAAEGFRRVMLAL